ncbi:MAG: hypothetical protein ACYDDA_03780 [Acidiferrobacteraceae bacterium]
MGQITNPAAPGITVLPNDRQTGPKAGPGNSADLTLFLSANAGKNNAGADSIALGNGALASGNTNAGMIAIGVGAEASVVGARFAGDVDIAIGQSANGLAQLAGNMVVIGHNALSVQKSNGGGSQGYESVIIGAYALSLMNENVATGGVIQSVIIGSKVGGQNSGAGNLNTTVVIGYNAITGLPTLGGSIVIGDNTIPNLSGGNGLQSSVVIGSGALPHLQGLIGSIDITAVGAQTSVSANTTPTNCVALGQGAWIADHTTCLGAFAGSQGTGVGSPGIGSIYIGAQAGYIAATPANWTFLIESYYAFVGAYTMMYGVMNTGNLSIGNLPAADRDFAAIGCTNALKLTDGTRGAGAPTGGGFFYSSAGALHWVDTAGNDNLLSLNASGQLAASSVNYTNNAGAQAATIGNAPIAGNPTKWIPIDDNGTIRNIPAW